MADAVSNFHTSIRRYCIERRTICAFKYSEIQASGKARKGHEYTDEALLTFPRYQILDAILEQFERYRPAEFTDLQDAKAFFKIVASDTNLGERFSDGLEKQAIEEERSLLADFIELQTFTSLLDVKPLFYRRVITDTEDKGIRTKLKERWKVERGYWFPLTEDRLENVEAFQDTHFETEVGSEKLASILTLRGVQRVWEIRESGPSYEMDASEIEPYYGYGAEGFWCDNTFEWIIYASHEASVTVGGWLLEDVKAAWPNWRDRVWTSWDFE